MSALIALIISLIVVNAQQACVVDSDCPATAPMYCMKSSCKVDTGICSAVPDFCSSHYDPVCSCKNITFGNACLAAAARANVAYKGECPSEPGCLTNADCAPNNYCLKITGACDDNGFCAPVPATCPPDAVPVCGCDGKTYKSECLANQGGVSVSYGTACIPTVSCGLDSDCQPGDFCKQPVGSCINPARINVLAEKRKVLVTGTCAPLPDTCSTQYDPVCGCNGKTYTNGCFADLEKMPIAYIDECNTTEECSSDSDCDSAELCQKDIGACGDVNIVGACIEKPAGCFTIFMPVCGCDNKTYSNDCLAYAQGVNIAFDGACATFNNL